MSKYVIDETTLVAIGDAIREKDGTTDKIQVKEFADRISAIEGGGGGGYEPPEVVMTGTVSSAFAYGTWDWFVEDFPNKITTKDISNASYMFNYSKLERIPFEINLSKTSSSISGIFAYMENLKEAPVLKCPDHNLQTASYTNGLDVSQLFSNCVRLRELPDNYFLVVANQEYWDSAKEYSSSRSSIFSACRSLRKHPKLNMLMNKGSAYQTFYSNCFVNCHSIDEINLPVIDFNALTSNCFSNAFNNTYRLKRLKFEVNEDGTPKVAQWKSQVIDLATQVGYQSSYGSRTYYSSAGLSREDEITDEQSYLANKDNPNAVVCNNKIEYSRFNHDSAVELINSLPDTSAYGTNTIKFNGASGSATDGGAVNTLTEAEIAVATARGWTVTFL